MSSREVSELEFVTLERRCERLIKERDTIRDSVEVEIAEQLLKCAGIASLQWALSKVFYPDDLDTRDASGPEWLADIMYKAGVSDALLRAALRLKVHGVIGDQ